jgi:hypothetical protein
MKAKELRIGNYLLNAKNDDYFEVELNDLEIIDTGKSKSRPIPLTEKWLLKFGLFYENEIGHFGDGYSGIQLMNISDKYFRGYFRGGVIKVDIEYVHQIQNLYFALTGEELTIKQLK